ncbi:MAG: hypothetical protein MUE85_11255 [Microscillaceae bacterium]|jgi:hypothetical protein|nr:hypothetical protein [Microscillaceae bacterium]
MSNKNGKLITNLKTSSKSEEFAHLSPARKKQILLRKAQHYQDNIKEDIQQVRNDLILVGAIAGAAFLGFKLVTTWLGSNKKNKPAANSKPLPEQYVIISEKPAKKSSLVWELLSSRVATFVVDALVTKVLENLPTRKSKDDE